jgi:hypothetical protein
MILGVALIVLNIAATPWMMDAFQGFTPGSIGVIEMAAILVLPLPAVALRLARTGRIDGLAFGFEAFGWAGVLAYLACLVFAPDSVANYGDAVISPLWRAFGPGHTMATDPTTGETSVSIEATDRMSTMLWGLSYVCACTLPQVAFATLGGWLFQRLRVKVVVSGRDSSVEFPGEPDPPVPK